MTPFQLMLGRESRIAFSALVTKNLEGVQLEPINETKLREQIKSIVNFQGGLHQRVRAQVTTRKSFITRPSHVNVSILEGLQSDVFLVKKC